MASQRGISAGHSGFSLFPWAEADGTGLGPNFVGVVAMVPRLAPKVARQTGRREGKPFCKGNSHHGARIGSGIDLELKGWGGIHLGEKSGELGFGHGNFLLP